MIPNDMAKRVENNHDELDLRQILFMLPTEIKNKIKKLEKAHNVFIDNKYGLIFTKQYLRYKTHNPAGPDIVVLAHI